jgi:ATP-binding cassette, subfamily B, bacterial PglK
MMNHIFKLLPKKSKKRFTKTIIMSFFSSGLELLSLSLIIPIIYFVINPDNELLSKIISFLKLNFQGISNDNIYNYLIISLISIFIIKTVFISYFVKYQHVFKRNLRSGLAQLFFTKYLKLQYIETTKKSFAEMQKNIDSETLRFSELVHSYIMFINEFIMAITIIIFLFFFNFKITLILSIIFFIIFILLYLTLKNKFKSWGEKGQEAFKNYNNTILQSFNNLRETKLQGKEDFFTNKFLIDNKLKNLYEYNHRLYSMLPRYFIELIAVLLIFLILFIMLKNNNELDYVLATLGLFAYASVRLLPILNKLTNLVGQIRYFSYSSELLLNELDFLNRNYNLNFRKNFKENIIDTIELKHINFAYKNKLVLKDLSLELKKGSVTGIYGSSGSGKTTLLDILSSLMIPNDGEILINNKKVEPKEFFWGKKISYISQSTDLFNDTIQYNITFGENSTSIDKDKMNYSLKAASLKDFVQNLPEGLNTVVGEKGSQISSGQKQRINIARALYNESKVLIMDESTNSLDAENEKLIFDDIIKTKKNLILLIVSHNKDLLRKFCDNLYELKNYKLNKI